MKKCFYIVLAAVAIVASCAKVELKEDQKIEPKAGATAQFSGTIIQPNGLGGGSKVYIAGQDETKVYVSWNKGDKVQIKREQDKWAYPLPSDIKTFSAQNEGARTEFVCSESIEEWAAETSSYSAYYFGTNNAWWEYVFATSFDVAKADKLPSKFEFDCGTGNEKEIPVLLENMPLYSKTSTAENGYYYFNFFCYYGILQINVPAKLDFSDLYVCLSSRSGEKQDVTFVNGALTEGSEYALRLKNAARLKNISKYEGKEYVTYFVPVANTTASDNLLLYSEIRVVAVKGSIEDGSANEVARMKTYEYSNNTEDPVSLNVVPNTIHFFDFCNTLTIKNAGSYDLVSNDNINYKVNIASNIDSEVTIDAEEDGFEPDSIFINNHGHTVGTLNINARKSHVEGENGFAGKVVANTSNSTFVVKKDFTIKEHLTVAKGSVVVDAGNGAANVKQIIIPEEAEGTIIIDVTGVSGGQESDRVEIVNNSAKEKVVVVADKTDVDDKKVSNEYYINHGEVTEVTKGTVATIGETGYATLADAFASAKDDDIITLVSSTELSAQVELAGKAITLDLNGQAISWNGGKKGSGIILVHNGAGLTINDTVGTGKIYSGGENQAYAAVALTKSGDSDASAAVLTVNGGELEGWYYAVVGNGERHNTVVNINGGTLKTAVGSAIYNPQNGKINIAGGVVEGYETGIYMKAGTAVATGGTIRATGPKNPYKYDGSGANGTGDAIVVDNCGYPGGAPSLTINGAELVSANAYQVGAYYDGKNATEISDIFSSDNTLTVPAGYEWQEDATPGMYKLVKAAAKTAKIGDKEYATLADALADVPTDGTQTTIVLVADVALEGNAGVAVNAGQNVVLDLNGKTLSNLVTESKASQVIDNKGTLTVKNGTLTNALGNDAIAGDWPTYNYATNVITNCGNLVLENCTISNTQNSGICYAVDNNNSAKGVSVTINGGTYTSAGNSAIRMFCNNTSSENNLTINGGTFTAHYYAVRMQNANSNANKGNLNITGGEFNATDASEGYDYSICADSSAEFSIGVTGGTFNNHIVIKPGCKSVAVSGGQYKMIRYEDHGAEYMLSDYLARDFEFVKGNDGYYTIQEVKLPWSTEYPQAFVSKISNDNLDVAYSFNAYKSEDMAIASKLMNDSHVIDFDLVDNLTPEESSRMQAILSQVEDYAGWNADFEVSFDKPVKEGSLDLSGQYLSFSEDWIPYPMKEINANQTYRLLADNGIMSVTMTYEEICTKVITFNCGAVNYSSENIGTTMTVQLRLYVNDGGNGLDGETGKSYKIGEYKYTFDKVNEK